MTSTTTLAVRTTTFTSFANEAAYSICTLRQEWSARTQKNVDDHTVRLRDFASREPDLFFLKLGITPRRKLRRVMPDAAHHAARRKWQATAPIYDYQPDAFSNQTSAEVAGFLRMLSCGNKTAT